MSTYDASAIAILPPLEAVRRRPAMYVGSTGPQGLLHLLLEVVQNAVDEAMAGACTTIRVKVDDDGTVEVADDGRGIPVGPVPGDGRPACEVVMTTLHAGGKFGEGAYVAPGGLHGVGVSCVNALSERLDLEIKRDGGRWHQRFARGAAQPLEHKGVSLEHGTTVRYKPDPVVFGDAKLPLDAVVAQLQAQAWLHPGLELSLHAPGHAGRWRSEEGLAGFVAALNAGREVVHAPLRFVGSSGGVDVDVALQWSWGWHEDLRAYVNGVPTPQGGSHVEGLWSALIQVLDRHAATHKLLQPGERLSGFDVREGLAAVVSVRIREPLFEGQTKAALSSPEALPAVEGVVTTGLAAALEADRGLASSVIGRALEAARARAAARRAGERARYRRVDLRPDPEVYKEQFGIRSKNWHESAVWLTHQELLAAHGGSCVMGPDAHLLDVCCGSGVVGNSFRGKVGKITGLDLTPQMVNLAKQRLDEVVQGNVYDIPFPDGKFDAACSREVLHLLPRPERPVSEIFRVLRPGGQFVYGQWVPFGVEDAPWMFRIVKRKQPLFFNHLMEEDLVRLFTAAGFVNVERKEILQWEDIDRWIDTWETPPLARHQIRDMYRDAPEAVRRVHPFEISPEGAIRDCWRWVVFSCFKPE